MKFKIQVLALGLCLWSAAAQAQDAPKPAIEINRRVIDTNDTICESPKLKLVVDAIQCVANNCPELNDEKKKIYENFCTTGPRLQNSDGIHRVRERESLNLLDSNVTEFNRVVVVDETTPEETKLLPPCECLAKLKERFAKCDIELCKPPQEPEQPQTPDTPKEVTPDTPKEQTGPKQFLFEGSGCSLNAATGLSAFGGWALVLAIPAAWASRRKKK
ncbi:MAG: hypothetical protein IT572_01895 [Deltaproteobacteria bacterium]|nr:hypothetical protein [Deltaproteobacteria bacterium]